MAKVYVFLANGFEEVEAMAPVDVLRRAGIEVVTVSITGSEFVKGAHNVIIKADKVFTECKYDDAELVVLPGGMPGATNLNEHQGLRNLIIEHNLRHKKIGAICAAPLVLGGLGLLKGKKATCYPGFEKYLTEAEYTAALVTVDSNIITGEGPAASLEFAYTLLEQIAGSKHVAPLREGMMYNHRETEMKSEE